jgi:hypothetical protein
MTNKMANVPVNDVRVAVSRGDDVSVVADRHGLPLVCVEAIVHGRPWRRLTVPAAIGDLFAMSTKPTVRFEEMDLSAPCFAGHPRTFNLRTTQIAHDRLREKIGRCSLVEGDGGWLLLTKLARGRVRYQGFDTLAEAQAAGLGWARKTLGLPTEEA